MWKLMNAIAFKLKYNDSFYYHQNMLAYRKLFNFSCWHLKIFLSNLQKEFSLNTKIHLFKMILIDNKTYAFIKFLLQFYFLVWY